MADRKGTWRAEHGDVAVHCLDQGGWPVNYSRWKGREGRRFSNCQTQESLWWHRQGKGSTVYLEMGKTQVFSCALCFLFYLLLLLSPKILLWRVLLNPAIFQRGFCSPSATCFTCKQKSSCPFCADDLPPPSRFMSPHRSDRHTVKEAPHAGSAQPGPLASFLPLSNPQTPLPTASSAALDVISWVPLRFSWLSSGNSHPWGGQVSPHTRQLLLDIKRATPPVQAASFYRPSPKTFPPSQSLLQWLLSMILLYYFLFQASGIYLV